MKNNNKYLIVGLGMTGCSIARYLTRRNSAFVLYDTRYEIDNLAELRQVYPETDIYLGDLPETVFNEITQIIVSPGVALDATILQQAQLLNCKIIGDIECFAKEVTAPIIAITGTNGKSTVTSLVGEMLKAQGLQVAVAGNIGQPVLDLVDNGQHYDVWVIELSSFQLELTYSLQAKAATILNISPDHLDRHGNFDHYVAAKKRIYTNSDVALYNADDQQTFVEKSVAQPMQISFSLQTPSLNNWGIINKDGQIYLAHGPNALLAVDELRIKGKHNWQNALAAAALATVAGVEQSTLLSVLKNYPGLPHRCQWVRTLDGVSWINDSKGTNIGACASALAGIGENCLGKVVVIAGGLGKGADFSELKTVVSQYARCLILIGADAGKIAEALQGIVPSYHYFTMLDAIQGAKKYALPDDVVLLSPACASQDMFRDFNHRGEIFTKLVQEL